MTKPVIWILLICFEERQVESVQERESGGSDLEEEHEEVIIYGANVFPHRHVEDPYDCGLKTDDHHKHINLPHGNGEYGTNYRTRIIDDP